MGEKCPDCGVDTKGLQDYQLEKDGKCVECKLREDGYDIDIIVK